jgi:hypothetical protein
MIKPAPEQPRGIAGLALLFCGAALVAGLGFDFLLADGARFSVIGEPGGRAVLGIGVAAAVVLIAHAMRFALGKPPRAEGEDD